MPLDFNAQLITRRKMLGLTGTALAGSGWLLRAAEQQAQPRRRWTLNLMGGMIGVGANQLESIDLASRHGFESVEPMPRFLADLPPAKLQELVGQLRAKGLSFGAASLPVDFRREEEQFLADVKALPRLAEALRAADVTRVGTWLTPGSNRFTFLENLKLHGRRLREAARILADQQLRFGLEYVGTKTSRDRFRYEFVHSMAETKELIAEIGAGNVGFVLDSWHWWQAEDTVADILTLTKEQIVAVDLNDAPLDIPKEKQLDGQRELPAATGVIDLKSFLGALQHLNYDGPVRAEPFNKALNALDNEEACRKTIEALKRAAALAG